MGLSPAGGRNNGGRNVGGGDIHILPPEHSCTVYCVIAHYEPVSAEENRPGSRVTKQWLDQDRIDV